MIGFWKYENNSFLSAVIEGTEVSNAEGAVFTQAAKGYGNSRFRLSHFFEHDEQGKQAQEAFHQLVEAHDAAVDRAAGLFKDQVDAWKAKYSFFEIDNQHKRIAQISKEKEDGYNK